MDRERILNTDVNILLSWVNTKLRDEFDNLDSLCEEYDVQADELSIRLEDIGYKYSNLVNQFKAV